MSAASLAQPIDTQAPAQAPTAHQQWLDEVRAQREAWQARRKAKQAAADARLRQLNPWGAARIDELEQQAANQREAARSRSEQLRRSSEARLQVHRETLDKLRDAHPPYPAYTPYGWNNTWYFQGY